MVIRRFIMIVCSVLLLSGLVAAGYQLTIKTEIVYEPYVYNHHLEYAEKAFKRDIFGNSWVIYHR